MTIRTCCGLLAAVLVASVAVAQSPSSPSPHPSPLTTPPSPPPSAPYAPPVNGNGPQVERPAPPAYAPCPVPPPCIAQTATHWTFTAVEGKLQIQMSDGSGAVCEKLTIPVRPGE